MDDLMPSHRLFISWQICADLLLDALARVRDTDDYFIPAEVLVLYDSLG